MPSSFLLWQPLRRVCRSYPKMMTQRQSVLDGGCVVIFCLILLLPVVVKPEMTYTINEELDVGSVVGELIVDAQLNSNLAPEVLNSLRFTFLMPPTIPLSVDEMFGRITTSGRIDREAICRSSTSDLEKSCKVRLDVAVHSVQYFQMIKVVIEVQDINDNSPEFTPSSIVREMVESSLPGSGFVIPAARDADTTKYGVSKYEISPGQDSEMFELRISKKLDGSTEVRLVLVKTLDRESVTEHHVRVTAYDADEMSPRTGNLDVTIVVLDSNDNSPVFEYSAYEVAVVENIPVGTIVARVVARDQDIGLNGHVTYSLSASTQSAYGDVFAVDDMTGDIIVVGSVDYERASVYHLIVTARDRGPEPTPTETTVVIKVDDVNDNAPHVTINTLTASGTDVATIYEDAAVGTFVGHMIVQDPDRDASGRFNCSLESATGSLVSERGAMGSRSNKVVSIVRDDVDDSDVDDNFIDEQPDTGDAAADATSQFRLQQMYITEYHIVTASVLDRERKDRYQLAIVCMDGGIEPQISTKVLTIDILDVNDNKPVFDRPVYTADMYENNYSGATVIQVNASDNDVDDNALLHYEMVPGSGSHEFTVDRATGTISAAGSLDRERQSVYKLQIRVSDGGVPRLTSYCDVIVNVLDVNDELPRFQPAVYRFEVTENQPPKTQVGTLHAVDNDLSPFNSFHFGLISLAGQVPAETLEPFRINPDTGAITTTRELDREMQSEYRLIAVATDVTRPEMTSTASVTVVVRDVNDNRPVFVFPSAADYTLRLNTWQIQAGQSIGRIEARDDDVGANADIVYGIDHDVTDSDSELFNVDPQSGIISANVPLRPGLRDNATVYSLTVTASNYGPGHGQGHSHRTMSVLRILLDRPQPAASSNTRNRPTFVFTGNSLIAVVAVGTVSAVVIVTLLVAIATVLCRQRRRNKEVSSDTCPVDNDVINKPLTSHVTAAESTINVSDVAQDPNKWSSRDQDVCTDNGLMSSSSTQRNLASDSQSLGNVQPPTSTGYYHEQITSSTLPRSHHIVIDGTQRQHNNNTMASHHTARLQQSYQQLQQASRCIDIANSNGCSTNHAAVAAAGGPFRLPPPSYHSISSFKPTLSPSYANNAPLKIRTLQHQQSDDSNLQQQQQQQYCHTLSSSHAGNGKLLRSCSVNQTGDNTTSNCTSTAYSPTGYHGIQIRRLHSVQTDHQ